MSVLALPDLLAASALPLTLALPTDPRMIANIVARDEKKDLSSTTKWIIIAVCALAGVLILSFTLHFFRKWLGCGGERMKAKDAAVSAMQDMNRRKQSNNNYNGGYYGGGTAYPDQAILHHQQQMDWDRQQQQNNAWHEQHYGGGRY